MQRTALDIAKVGLVTVLYFAAAKLGLRLATVTSSVSLVWPPTGIAIAALLLLGRRAWPGIALGALAANMLTPGVGPLVALGIATGNTLEALVAVTLLKRWRFEPSMRRIGDVAKLVVLAAVVSTLASASIGTASLAIGGVIGSGSPVTAWVAWWIGDMMGAIVFTPLFLTLASLRRPSAKVARIAELLLWATGLVAVTLSAFGLQRWVEGFDYPQAFAVFPLVETLRHDRTRSAELLGLLNPAPPPFDAGAGASPPRRS